MTPIFIGLFQVYWYCNVKRVGRVQCVKNSNRLELATHCARRTRVTISRSDIPHLLYPKSVLGARFDRY